MIGDHLSDWEIEELIIDSVEDRHGASDGDQAWQHLKSCEFCASTKERLHEVLDLYRDAAMLQAGVLANRETGDDSAPKGAVTAPIITLHGTHSWATGLGRLSLALLLLLAVLIPFFIRHQRERHAAEIARDNLLLEQVDREVNASVPDPLQSLTNLVVANENAPQ